MYGIEAINAHNGWAMAIAGALIVMSGLSVLSFIISQLHRVLDLMDNGKKADDIDEPSAPTPIPAATVDHDLSNLKDSLSCYCDETAGLGSAFTLPDLFKVFQDKGIRGALESSDQDRVKVGCTGDIFRRTQDLRGIMPGDPLQKVTMDHIIRQHALVEALDLPLSKVFGDVLVESPREHDIGPSQQDHR